MRQRLASLVFLAPIWFGCSSSDFDVAAGAEDAASDTAVDDLGIPEDDAVTIDDGPPPSDAPCVPLTETATTIYVDARATGAPMGSAECPTKTIAEAIAILDSFKPAIRTIRVAGTTGTPLFYNEKVALYVKGPTTIAGSGAGQVIITGGGACKTATCVMVLEGPVTVEGVTIKPGPAIGLAVGPTDGATATVRNVVVTGGTNNAAPAIYVNGPGAAVIGPGVKATDNAGVGLSIETALSTKVNGFFDRNLAGISVRGGVINIEGGQAQKNTTFGVSLLSNAKHTIKNFDVRENSGIGVFAEGNAHLLMRSSTLVKNRIGLVFRFGTANELDLGTSLADAGKNNFGNSSNLNQKAAVCLPLSRATKAPAWGNLWFYCDPTRLPLLAGATCEGISTYQDVYYAPADPTASHIPTLDWSACDVAP